MKRDNVISWDQYFMGLAHLSAMRSKDPSTQVGAVLVSPENKIISIGYNGMPLGLSDDEFPWQREGEFKESKYAYVVHAELNAILNARQSVAGCRAYVTLFPCNECAKALIQGGIKEIVYEQDVYAETDVVKVSKHMLSQAGVVLTQLKKPVLITLE